MLDENDTNEVVDGGTSDAEGNGYKCVVCFQDGMKEVDSKCLCWVRCRYCLAGITKLGERVAKNTKLE